MAKQNLGMVTAYAYAVVGGYEGTEAEFEALLGNIATDLAEIENLTVIANTLPPGSSATASYDHGVLTLGIPKGDKGDTGAGATVTAGTTATGDPGTNASVTNSGTTKDAVFNFTIPRGDTGNGIESIYLTGTSGAVKTYTILFTDGNTTTFDVTDGEVTNAALTAVLADYAKIDGAYESMTVGNAEQLVSTVFVNDEEPYNFRTSGGSADIGDREYDTVVGGTVAWNQLIKNPELNNTNNIYGSNGTVTASNGMATITANGVASAYFSFSIDKTIINHVYVVSTDVKLDGNNQSNAPTNANIVTNWSSGGSKAIPSATKGTKKTYSTLLKPTVGDVDKLHFYPFDTATPTPNGDMAYFSSPLLIDLTQMFGSTIADYIYSLEQATAGAGVAWFRKLFPKPYYAYNTGELMSVNTSAHNTVGFNQWDEEVESGYIKPSTGEAIADASKIRMKNYMPVLPNTTYYKKTPVGFWCVYFDADKNYIGYGDAGANTTFTTPPNCYYIRSGFETAYGTTYNHDICINLSWDGERDGEYEEYVKHSYPLDSSLTLRGIPKLDASNNLYYDGDTYESDGTVTRNTIYRAYQSGDESLSNAITDGTNTVVYSANASTETADPFQSPQIVDDFGTEEYVDYAMSEGDRDVAIPVGHVTKYTNNLRAKLEMSPNSPDGAGDYLVRQTNGINEYVSLASNATIQDIIARLEALEGGGE